MVVYQSNMVGAVRKGYRATHCKNGQEQRYEEEQNESSTEPDIVDVFIRAINRKSTTEDHAHIESLRSAARERGLGKREGK